MTVFLLWVAHYGDASRVEFSPVSFEFRVTTKYYVPHTDLLLYSVEHEPYRNRITQYWIDCGYFTPPLKVNLQQWDTLSDWKRWEPGLGDGEAWSFWGKAACRSKTEVAQWMKWSEDHPQLAEKLWPKVIQLLRDVPTNQKQHNYYVAAQLMLWVGDSSDELSYQRAYEDWERRFCLR
jgi:hypothetical protein